MKTKDVKCVGCGAMTGKRSIYPDGWCVEHCDQCGSWRHGKGLEENE